MAPLWRENVTFTRGWTSENDSDKTFIPFCAPRNTLTIERHGAPPGFTYREGRGATSLPPTSREERLRNELPKEKKDRVCCACNGPVLKDS